MDGETGSKLRELAEKGATVRIWSRICYREITAENIIGILPGSKADEVILVTAHYDDWCVIPQLANSKWSAISPAYLLELARILSKTKPLRTVWFVFFSGHWQALSGAREFVEKYYFSPEVQNGTIKPLMLINIGYLDPYGYGLQLLRGGAGTFYGTSDISSGITLRYAWVRKQIFTNYLHDPNLRDIITNLMGVDPVDLVKEFFTHDMFWGTESSYYMLDSEPAEMTRGISFTIQTAYSAKQWLGSPVQPKLTYQELSLLKPQIAIVTHLVHSFINEKEWGISWDNVSPSRLFIMPGGFSQYAGFITLKGRTLIYNLTTGWYRPLSRALVRVYIGTMIGGINYCPYPYPFNKIIVFSDENGNFEIHGLAPFPFLPARYLIEGWIINETNGKIIYAPDLGIYGAKAIPPVASPLSHPEKASVVLMRVEAITLYDLFDPRTGSTGLMPDPRAPGFSVGGGWFYNKGIVLQTQDFISRSEPLFYGVYYNGYEPVGLAFAIPRSRVAVIAKSGGMGTTVSPRPFLVAVNASKIEPEGHGIYALSSTPSAYAGNALTYAKDIVLISRSRYEKLRSRGVSSVSVNEKLSKAEQYLAEAYDAYMKKAYSDAYRKALVAWAWGIRAYEEVMTLIDDSGRTSLMFFALIIPAAIMIEKLLVSAIGRNRLIAIIGIGGLLVLAFALVHPALTVMSNSIMALMGILAFALFIMTLGILMNETQKVLRQVSYRLLGYHVATSSRFDIALTSFSVSLEDMRRRRLRTFLVFTSIMVISLAVTSLTSVSPYMGVKEVKWVAPPLYNGLLIKSSFSTPPSDILGFEVADIVEGLVSGFGAKVFPRVWYYPTSIGPNIGVVTRLVREENLGANMTYYNINALLGLKAEDAMRFFAKYGTVAPLRDDVPFCIIPSSAAEVLGVKLGDRVVVQGVRLIVLGIYNTSVLTTNELKDLSGLPITPTDPFYVPALGLGVLIPGQQTPRQLSPSSIIVVPYSIARDLGGYLAEVSVVFPEKVNEEELGRIAEDLSMVLDHSVYVKKGDGVIVYSRVSTFLMLGWESIVIVLVLGALNLVASLLSVYNERIEDMYVYTAVGLSPSGAAAMFVIEALTYSILGILAGYFLGFVMNSVLLGLGFLPPGFAFNYATVFVVLSFVILILTAVIASVYPAYKAAKLITPSLERKWKPPTRPKGDIWELPLPLKLTTLEESKGVLEFLREYYLGAGTERPGFRIRNVELNLSEQNPSLLLKMALTPYEAGVLQSARIQVIFNEKDNRYDFITILNRVTGDRNIWTKSSYLFLDDLRKQLLLWRSLSKELRKKYITRALNLMTNSH